MDNIKVKKYLTFSEKCQLVNDVCEISFNGIDYDPNARECAQVFMIAKMYSDIDIEYTENKEDAVKTYDKIMIGNAESVYNKQILKHIPRLEIRKVEEMIESSINEKKRRSTITYEITKKFSSMDIDELLKEMKAFDFSKFREIGKILEKSNSAIKKV